MRYLTGASGGLTQAETFGANIGLMLQPGNGYLHGLEEAWPFWAADNGCFAQGEAFEVDAWLRWLDRVPSVRCLFAVAPDVFSDAERTLRRARPLLGEIQARGLPAAFVAQNGAEATAIPWDEFACLFLGGTTAWKLGAAARGLIQRAREQGKAVHMGRVNSARRLRYASLIGCDTADGTFLKFGPMINRPRLFGWFRQACLPLRVM
jgi:hypothetical protein